MTSFPLTYEGRKARWRARDREHRTKTTPKTTSTNTNPQENTMAADTTITIIGNLTADPEMRFTPSGAAVASFTIASTPRTFDRQRNEWVDGETLFMRCSVWREAAENVAESLRKGMRVIAQGRLQQRSYQTREGENRTVVELAVEEVGPSLRRAKAQVTRTGGQGQPQGQGGGQWGAPQGGSGGDPWASQTAPF